jgi:hypothetical protein
MPPSLVDADSMLVVDVGSISTRAMLFDVVEGRYRFVAAGAAPSTAAAPFLNVSEGVRAALDNLQQVTGRSFLDGSQQLIMPAPGDGSGVDAFAALFSAGAPLRVVVVGLLEDVSLESAKRLVQTIFGQVALSISLNDRRKPEARMDAILRTRPDLIVVAGGVEGGASQSVLKLLEAVALACYLMPENQRPQILFVGNQALKARVEATLGGLAKLHFAPNIRPTLEVEQLEAAHFQAAKIFGLIRSQQLPGIAELNTWAKGSLAPASTALGRVVRFLSKTHGAKKGVLGVDVSASATSMAAAFAGQLTIGVYPQLGLGQGAPELCEYASVASVKHWLSHPITDDQIIDYAYNKSIFPASLPVTPEEFDIELALARQAMQSALRLLASGFPDGVAGPGGAMLPWMEPVILTGSIFARAPNLAYSALLALDGLQPTGASTLVLDQNQIAAALGAAAAVNPLMAVQILDSNSFLHLGTVISPIARVRPGVPVLKLKMTYEGGQERSLEVKQGVIEMLPLPYGQTARLQLHPLHRADVGMGSPGRGGTMRVIGGALGVIIDARGRPLKLPDDVGKRSELYKKWLSSLGAKQS